MMAFLILFSYKSVKNKKQKNILLLGKSKNENSHPKILLCSSTKTSTFLVLKSKINIPTRSYGSTGGSGKVPKLPSSNSTGTNVPPTNKGGINITPAQAKDAFLQQKNSQPYNLPQIAEEAEKASSTPKPITPHPGKALFQDTMFDQQKKQAEQQAKNKIDEETVKKMQEKQMEQTHKEHLKEYLLKKFKEENNIKDNSLGTVDGAGFIVTQNIYKHNTTPTVAIQPPSSVQKEEEKTNTSTSLEPISQIPPAPSLPPKPLFKQPSSSDQEIPLIEQIKILENNTPKDKNIIPSTVKSLLPKILKNISGKEYITKIDEATTTISDEDLIKELKSRELIKEDNGNTAVSIKVEGGDSVLVGSTKHKIKLTPLGQAYGKDCQKPTIIPQENTFKNDEDIELMIITPPKPSENTFIETGKQKHLLIAHSKDNDTYYAIGYLTSKKTGEHLSDTQFKKFQQQGEGEELKSDVKKQKFFLFDHMEELSKTDVNIAELSQEYLSKIDAKILDKIVETTHMLEKKPVLIFNKDGITKENGIEICKQYDINVINKKKHPQTDDQIQQQQQAKEKQQEKQKEEKELKDKIKDQHDQIPS